jgi:hypothetical protein
MIGLRSKALRVDVRGGEIIVTMPGTGFRVIYARSHDDPGLVATSFHGRNGQETKIKLPTFLAHAWTVANDKARELHWLK